MHSDRFITDRASFKIGEANSNVNGNSLRSPRLNTYNSKHELEKEKESVCTSVKNNDDRETKRLRFNMLEE